MSVKYNLRPIAYGCIDTRPVLGDGDDAIVDFYSGGFNPAPIRYDGNVHVVTAELYGKPNLISKITMGSEDYADLLLHYNAISNPYSVDDSCTIIIPNAEDAVDRLHNPIANPLFKNVAQIGLNLSISKSDKDAVLDSISKSKNGGGFVNHNGVDPNTPVVRTPNMAQSDDEVKVDGAIIFGTNVNIRCAGSISENQHKTEIIRKSIRESILGRSTT